MTTTRYASLADVRAELNAENTVDDADIMRGLLQVSRRIDQKLKRKLPFAPYREARRFAITGSVINSIDGTLLFNMPLLSLTGVSAGSTTLTVGTNVQAYPVDSVPYYQLQLMGDAWYSWYRAYCSDVRGPQFATITGIWGYHSDYANAWQDVDALTEGINDSVTTLTVADVDGVSPWGDEPRISAGHLLQIDDEWMDVIATDTDDNTVTVIRGVNGSTAAAHEADATVSVFQVEDAIKRAVVRQVAFQYARRGAFDTVRYGEISIQAFPKDLLDEYNGLLAMFANM